MAKKTLNAGNYGGTIVDVVAGKTLVAIQSDEATYWLYDLSVHTQTPTADYTGTCGTDDPRIKEATTLVLDFRGA
jgi:hypothetical protein